ncbi:MAG: GDP-mannose 4,6-dehydratase [Candidatus Krumholzibacteriota bacterium]|nr:GDP-mannose 4,6-dehydratase [Candidatus Krumholzibacteriota bacterium]
MKALVTGAYGFVGRYLAAELSRQGWAVLATDKCRPDRQPVGPVLRAFQQGEGREVEKPGLPSAFPPGTEYRMVDLMDAAELMRLIGDWKPDAIFHLAALSAAGKSFQDPRATLQVNVIGTLNLLEAVRKASPLTRILVTGSGEEYGIRSREEMPLGEDCSLDPVNPYAASKAAQTILARQYHRAYALEIVITRSFNHSGPGQSDVFVLPSWAKQCARIKLQGRSPRIRTGDTSVIRDFLDVRDVCRAYFLLVRKGRSGEIYNVCSGRGLMLRDALQMLLNNVPGEITVETDPALRRPVNAPVLIGDNRKLREETGWRSQIPVETMLQDLASWWEKEGLTFFS